MAIRSLITCSCLFSWDWKPAMSRIVFWFRYLLNSCWNRGRSSPVSRWCSSRYPSAASTAASSSAVSTGYWLRNSPIRKTILFPRVVRRTVRRSMTALTSVFAAISALPHPSASADAACRNRSSRPAIAVNCARAGSQPGSRSVAVTSSRLRPALAISLSRLPSRCCTPPCAASAAPIRSRTVSSSPFSRASSADAASSSRLSALSSSVRLTTDCQLMSANSRVWSSPAST
jgi:hypothetical protein